MGLNSEKKVPLTREYYDRALRSSHREAAATMAVALITVLYFWGTVLLLEESEFTLFSMPVWFVASCMGGYLVSVAGVVFLVKRCFTDIALDDAAEAYRLSAEKKEAEQ